ncbi:MAG: hypothetical protein AAF228_05355 [Pseudomonadota bacterium]
MVAGTAGVGSSAGTSGTSDSSEESQDQNFADMLSSDTSSENGNETSGTNDDGDGGASGTSDDGLDPGSAVSPEIEAALAAVRELLNDAAYANLYQSAMIIPASTYKAICSSIPKQ